MKLLFSRKLLVAAAGIIGAGLISAGAQAAQGTGTASVIIKKPVSVAAGTLLNFGTLSPGGSAGTAVLPSSGAAISFTGGVVALAGATSLGTAAVTGEPLANITVSLPGSPIALTGGTGADLQLTLDETSPAALDGTGDATVTVGGSLAIPANHGGGTYSGTYTVDVVYP